MTRASPDDRGARPHCGPRKRLGQYVRYRTFDAGLGKIVGNLTARYSLGFTLAEEEKDDGRLHSLDVRVKAQDDKGKTRKLVVSARQGYYMANATAKDATASRAQ